MGKYIKINVTEIGQSSIPMEGTHIAFPLILPALMPTLNYILKGVSEAPLK